jgi:hypothetical protein
VARKAEECDIEGLLLQRGASDWQERSWGAASNEFATGSMLNGEHANAAAAAAAAAAMAMERLHLPSGASDMPASTRKSGPSGSHKSSQVDRLGKRSVGNDSPCRQMASSSKATWHSDKDAPPLASASTLPDKLPSAAKPSESAADKADASFFNTAVAHAMYGKQVSTNVRTIVGKDATGVTDAACTDPEVKTSDAIIAGVVDSAAVDKATKPEALSKVAEEATAESSAQALAVPSAETNYAANAADSAEVRDGDMPGSIVPKQGPNVAMSYANAVTSGGDGAPDTHAEDNFLPQATADEVGSRAGTGTNTAALAASSSKALEGDVREQTQDSNLLSYVQGLVAGANTGCLESEPVGTLPSATSAHTPASYANVVESGDNGSAEAVPAKEYCKDSIADKPGSHTDDTSGDKDTTAPAGIVDRDTDAKPASYVEVVLGFEGASTPAGAKSDTSDDLGVNAAANQGLAASKPAKAAMAKYAPDESSGQLATNRESERPKTKRQGAMKNSDDAHRYRGSTDASMAAKKSQLDSPSQTATPSAPVSREERCPTSVSQEALVQGSATGPKTGRCPRGAGDQESHAAIALATAAAKQLGKGVSQQGSSSHTYNDVEKKTREDTGFMNDVEKKTREDTGFMNDHAVPASAGMSPAP